MGLRVAIAGCGTAGAASAALLARAGHEVTIFERVPDPQPVGAGIVLQPTGLWVLGRLGILDRVLARSARLEALRCVSSAGRTVVHLPYARLAPGLFGLGVHRGLLFEELLRAAGDAGAEIRCGVDIERIAADGACKRLVDARRDSHGPYDLVVVADGARSTLRESLGLVRRERAYDWGALWLVADDPDGVYRDELFQVVEGTHRFLGLLPSGAGPVGAGGVPKVSLFWSIRCDAVDDFRRHGLDGLRREVVRYDPRAAFLVEALDDPEQLLFAQYRDVVLRRFHAPGVVCLGDAAHSMSPQLGQGANLALWDAMVLADCLDRDAPLDVRLAGYSRSRRRHLAFYQLATRALTPLFQSDAGWLGPLRDRILSVACRMPLLRAQMLRTMCGVKRGLLRPSLPLDPLRRLLAEQPDQRGGKTTLA